MSDTADNAPQLILIIESTADGLALLAKAIAEFPPACVIIAPPAGLPFPAESEVGPPAAAPMDPALIKPLVEKAQAVDIATLVADDPDTAKTVGADGVHLTASKDLTVRQEAARKSLGTSATIGVLSDMTRHTAMVAGEAGADYIAFDLRADAPEFAKDMISWWAEIFEIPVAALVGFDRERARAAATAGADFIALTPPIGSGSAHTSALLDEVRAIMSKAREV